MKRAIGLEHLTLLETAPPELVTLAAAAGFDTVGLRVGPVTPDEETWPLYPGSPMLAETRRRCADTGLSVHAVEAIALGPGSVLAGQERVLETAATLGARYLNVICDDPDTGRFAELHIQRCRASVDEIAAVDPALLTYLQLCDAPRQQPYGLRIPAAMPRGQRAVRLLAG